MSDIEELVQFLQPESRFDIKRFAAITAAQLTGTEDGINLLQSNESILKALLKLIHDQEINTAKDAFRTIINISAEESGAQAILSVKDLNIIEELIKCIADKDYLHADFACGALANLTRCPRHCSTVLSLIEGSSKSLKDLVFILCQINYNNRGAKLHLLTPVLTNISQIPEGRKILLDREKMIFEKLIPFIDNMESKGRRKSMIGTLHNCCVDKENHMWLLSEEIGLASRLILPIAGPDTLTVEENDSLPMDLQYLADDKVREEDPEVRKLLLEAFMQLCMTKECREKLRDQNIYLILREHHKWEQDKHCTMLNEDIVNLLVRTEYEIDADDISAITVPDDLVPKFIKMDESYLAEEIEEADSKISETKSVGNTETQGWATTETIGAATTETKSVATTETESVATTETKSVATT